MFSPVDPLQSAITGIGRPIDKALQAAKAAQQVALGENVDPSIQDTASTQDVDPRTDNESNGPPDPQMLQALMLAITKGQGAGGPQLPQAPQGPPPPMGPPAGPGAGFPPSPMSGPRGF